MNISTKKIIVILGLCACLLVVRFTWADDAVSIISFEVKPSSCVALHKGQRCFQKLRFSWKSDSENEYCLFSNTHEIQLFCASSAEAEFIHGYSSESSESFSLRVTQSGLTVATISVNTAWVYRTGKRSSSGWRLF